MPRKSKSKKKVFEHDTTIETGFSTLQEGDHRIPIRGRDGVPPDLWENEIEGLAGNAKSDLPFERPTDDLQFFGAPRPGGAFGSGLRSAGKRSNTAFIAVIVLARRAGRTEKATLSATEARAKSQACFLSPL